MSVDDSVSSSRETTESRSESLPRDRVEKIRFSSEPPRRSNDDHLCTPTETDNRSSQASSYIESFMIPDEEDWVMWDKKIVLSCSGGGVRALCQLYLLQILFRRVAHFEKVLDPNNNATSSADSPLFRYDPGKVDLSHPRFRVPMVEGTYLPCHYFDYIGGTSVGGIIAVMFGRLRMSVDQGIRSFESIWKTMGANMSRYERVVPFRKAKTSNSLGLGRAFQDLLDERKVRLDDFFSLHSNSFDIAIGRDSVSDKFASDPELCKTIVIAMPDVLEDGLQRPFLFRSYEDPAENPSSLTRISSGSAVKMNRSSAILISEICRATSAVPGFFKGVNIGDVKFRDGAIWRNNPALELYWDIKASNPDIQDPIQLLVSLGSGRRKPRKFHSPTRRSSRSHGDDDSIDRFLSGKLESGYYSFEGPSDLSDLEINEWKIDGSGHRTFERIRKSTEHYCQSKEVKERIDRLAENLVKLRQSRARTTHWERFALGIRYTCRATPSCHSQPAQFDDRDSFMDHLMWEHNEPPQDEANWNRIQKLLADSQTTSVK